MKGLAFIIAFIGATACNSGGDVTPSDSPTTTSGVTSIPTGAQSPTSNAPEPVLPSSSPLPSPSSIPNPYAFGGGYGTSASPYSLRTPTDVLHIKDFLGAYFRLDQNVDMYGVELSPIGSISNPFSGTLNGNGYAINGISMQATDGSTLALFGAVSGTILDLNVGVSNMSSNGNVAGLVGALTGVVWSCNISGTFTSGLGGNGNNVGASNGLSVSGSSGEQCQVNQSTLPYIYGGNCLPIYSGSTVYNSTASGVFNGNRFGNTMNYGPQLPPILKCSNGTCSTSYAYTCVGPNVYSLDCTPPGP